MATFLAPTTLGKNTIRDSEILDSGARSLAFIMGKSGVRRSNGGERVQY